MGLKRIAFRTVLRYLILASMCFGLGFVYDYHLPKIESFLLKELKRFTRDNTPIQIRAKNLTFHLFPLEVSLRNVQIIPGPEINQYLSPATLGRVRIRLALWPLIRGDIRLSQIYLSDFKLNFFLKSEMFEKKSDSSSFKIDFDQLYHLPIDELVVENVQIQGRLNPQNLVFKIADLSLTIENRYKSIYVETLTPKILVKPSGPLRPLFAQLELRSLIEAKEAQVSALKLKADDSYIVASGWFSGDIANGKLNAGGFNTRTKLNLADLNIWEKVFSLNPKLPPLKGGVESDASLEITKDEGVKIGSSLELKNIEISKYIIGNVTGKIISDLKSVQAEKITVENNAGKAELLNLSMNLGQNFAGTARLNVKDVEIRKLLLNLGTKSAAPIELPVNGTADCSFTITSLPELGCTAEVNVNNALVHTGSPENTTIVQAKNLRAKGNFKVNRSQVEYKADLNVGKRSSGTSDGVIHYDNGFKLNYVAHKLDFSDIDNLANLKIEGETRISGSTMGTSNRATIEMKMEGQNLWLEDYPVGNANSTVEYKSGHLLFSNLQGQIDVTRYNGWIDLDLKKKRLHLSGQIPFMTLKDIQGLFARKVTLPFSFIGTGSGSVDAEGPLEFNRLSYTFKSNFFRGQIAGESFDELHFNVSAIEGNVKNDRITLTKSSGVVELKGVINPKGEIDAVAIGRGMRLEQSENIVGLGLDLQGLADFTILIRGQLPNPPIELNGRLSKMVVADQAAADSVFKLSFFEDRLEGSGQFLGTTLISEFIFPYRETGPFLFKLKTSKWDFTNLFSIISRSARQLDFKTSASMNVHIASNSGGFWNSTGRMDISEFNVYKVGKSMSAEKPMVMEFNNGVINSRNFGISSKDGYIKLDVNNLSRNNLNASLNGKLDADLLGLLTPFISDLRGNLAVSMELQGTTKLPTLSGSAYLDKGYIKLNNFPHPFSNVRADVLFNDNQILINSVRADLASGTVTGDGKILFNEKDHPIDIRGTFSEIKGNLPEGFHSQGSGSLTIKGSGFPYQMNVVYDVIGGEIVYELGEDSSGTNSIKPSAYLPRHLDKESFQPFIYSADINLKNPVKVNNSMVNASINGRVRVTGTPDRLALNGSFTPLPGGKIFFRDVPFDVGSAYVEYNGTGPDDPKVYLTATTRVTENTIDDQGRAAQNQFDVSMLVQGRGQDPQISFSSQPPLGQREIVSLLAFGMTGSSTGSDDRKASELQSANTSALLGAAILSRAGGKKVKDSFGVDVKVSSSQPTPDNASSPKVTLSKQWTPNFIASASSTIESNPNNNVKLEYKMNQSISVIGSWDGRESLKDQQKDTTVNVLGLDLQYKVQFK